jgi:C_GCAxxG_C_C family probable redox protein
MEFNDQEIAIIREAKERAESLYRDGDYLCSEAVFTVVNDYLERPVPAEAVRMASGFPVGMGTAGCACGALSGGIMALGLKFGRSKPKAEMPEMFRVSKELHDEFKKKLRSTCCRVLIKKFEFGSPEHLNKCIYITGQVTEMVMQKIIIAERSTESI